MARTCEIRSIFPNQTPKMRGGPISRILSRAGRNLPLDDHSSKDGVATAPLAANPDRRAKTCLRAVSTLADLPRARSLFGIAPGGACRASAVASPAVGSYPTVSPLLFWAAETTRREVCFLWRFPLGYPSRALPGTVVLWSPDFPPVAGLHLPQAAIRPSARGSVKRPARPGQRQSVQRYPRARPYRRPLAARAPMAASASAWRPEHPRR